MPHNPEHKFLKDRLFVSKRVVATLRIPLKRKRERNAMIGRTISNHKILEKLGERGMGVVYKVREIETELSIADIAV